MKEFIIIGFVFWIPSLFSLAECPRVIDVIDDSGSCGVVENQTFGCVTGYQWQEGGGRTNDRFLEEQFQETGWPARRDDELSDQLSR